MIHVVEKGRCEGIDAAQRRNEERHASSTFIFVEHDVARIASTANERRLQARKQAFEVRKTAECGAQPRASSTASEGSNGTLSLQNCARCARRRAQPSTQKTSAGRGDRTVDERQEGSADASIAAGRLEKLDTHNCRGIHLHLVHGHRCCRFVVAVHGGHCPNSRRHGRRGCLRVLRSCGTDAAVIVIAEEMGHGAAPRARQR